MLDSILGLGTRAAGWVNKNPVDDYWYGPRGISTTSGESISEETALTIATVFACIAKVSKTIASLPVSIIERTDTRTRHPVDHPLGELLSGDANGEASGMTLREALSANLEAWGNAYALIDWSGRYSEQIPARLHVLESRLIAVKRDDDTGELIYLYRNGPGKPDVLPASQVWHIPGFSLNGITGISTVGQNREALGLSMATTKFGNAFFGNGAWAGGFISRPNDAPGELSVEDGERLLASINEKFRGASHAFGLGLLREGMEFKQLDMPFEDAMFLNTRKFQRVEICGMFDVPPIMIHDNEKSTYSNTEQADLAFAKHSIVPRCVRLEQAAYRRFFKGTKLSLKHNLAGLLRGDFKTQSEGFKMGREGGWLSANDIREMLDRNPIEGGDTYLEPLNMWPVGQPRPVKNDPGAQSSTAVVPHSYPAAVAPDPVAIEPAPPFDPAAVILPPLSHAAEEIAARQCKAAKTAWTKHAKNGRPGSFAEWADKFFVEHAEVVRAKLMPIVEAAEAATGEKLREVIGELAGSLCRQWQAMISDEIKAGDVIETWKCGLAEEITSAVCGALFDKEETGNE